jgi:AraC-like DNA-binding protein
VRRRSAKRQKLVNDVKLLFSSDPGRRWTLTEVGAEIGASPVYLTQTFRDLEGMPLYQYQLRLRLGHALQVLDRSEDLTRLALDLGFSSPSHFSSALRAVYGQAPSTLRRSLKI